MSPGSCNQCSIAFAEAVSHSTATNHCTRSEDSVQSAVSCQYYSWHYCLSVEFCSATEMSINLLKDLQVLATSGNKENSVLNCILTITKTLDMLLRCRCKQRCICPLVLIFIVF